MSNSLRKIARSIDKQRADFDQQQANLNLLLFMSTRAKSEEHEITRSRLRMAFELGQNSLFITDPYVFLCGLIRARKAYNRERDGESRLMRLVDQILEQRVAEHGSETSEADMLREAVEWLRAEEKENEDV